MVVYCVSFFEKTSRLDGEYALYKYESSSPLPRYQAGDLLRTVNWKLDQKGELAVVDRVLHMIFELDGRIIVQQDVFCEFKRPIIYGEPAPPEE